MASSEITLNRRKVTVSPTRQRVMGIVFLVIGLAVLVLFARITPAEEQTKFVMTPGGITRGVYL